MLLPPLSRAAWMAMNGMSRRPSGRTRGWIGLSCLVWFALAQAVAVAQPAPFVAGYDRFFASSDKSQAMGGRLLLSELNCVACHAEPPAEEGLNFKGAPLLQGIRQRLNDRWLRAFLESPHAVKPGTTMPAMFDAVPAADRSRAIDAILVYLDQGEIAEPKLVASGASPLAHEFWSKGDVAVGRELYHRVGCIACHAIDEAYRPTKTKRSDIELKIEQLGLDAEQLEELGLTLPKTPQPVPMSNIAAKYSSRALTMFLLEPHRIRPAGRMPSLKLAPHEAADVAAYLMARDKPTAGQAAPSLTPSSVDEAASSEANAKRFSLYDEGKRWFESLGCGQCHRREEIPLEASKNIVELDLKSSASGCLFGSPRAPRYSLSDHQRESLMEAIADMQRGGKWEARDRLQSSLLQLNCFACHERHGEGGLSPEQGAHFDNHPQIDIGDEGRLPPSLSFVGAKLKSDWLKKVIDGTTTVRPHFQIRMPSFSAQSAALTDLLKAVDRSNPDLEKRPTTRPPWNEADLEAGRELVDAGCIQCHAWRGESLPGVVGVDLADIDRRLEPEWFEQFVLDPAGLKKNTRMPTFFPERKSANPLVLNGDVPKQIASLWGYLNSKEGRIPPKLEQSQAHLFELDPSDKPIILRTFMENTSAGTHAIAVGLPSRYHFAFDAKACRLAEIWQGKFLNAQGTWFDRQAPPAIPLGDHRIKLPLDSVLADQQASNSSSAAVEVRFLGYRLGPDGTPVFRYRIDDWVVEDQVTAQPAGLHRTIRWAMQKNAASQANGTAATPRWLVIAEGNPNESITPQRLKLTNGLEIEAMAASRFHEVTVRGKHRWLLRIGDDSGNAEWLYRW